MPSSGKQRITVLYVVTGLATGGAELMLLKLLTVIKERGIDPVVVSLMDEGTVGRKLAAIDVPVLTLNIRAKAFPLAALLDLRRMIRTVAPDLIQGWMYHGNIAATVGQWLSVGKRPVLWSVHHSLDDIGKEKRLTRLLIGLGARLSSSTAAVHYCSATSALQHEGIGFCKARSTVIPNGFDCLAFSPDPSLRLKIRRELAIGEDVLVVGHVARYHPIKDHGNFLAAAARLNREGVRACFVLSGAGVSWDNDELRALIGQHALQDRVFLLGERGDVPALMNAFDIYVSSSWSEAFPIAVGEAMACGTPCIATDVGDSALLVGATGKIVPPRDPERLAGALRELIAVGAEGRRALGRSARARIVEEFALAAVAERFVALYKGAAVDRTRSRLAARGCTQWL